MARIGTWPELSSGGGVSQPKSSTASDSPAAKYLRTRAVPPLCLGFLCLWLFFQGLGKGEFYRTEALRAQVAAEMLQSGNWAIPFLHGQPLLTKPPAMYVAIAVTSWAAGGVTEWTARFPSALAATLTVYLFYWYFSRHCGRLGGLIAASLLPVSWLWLEKGSAAEIDMLHVAFVAAAYIFFLRAMEGLPGRQQATVNPSVIQRFRFLAGFGLVADEPAVQEPATSRKDRTSWLWWLLAFLSLAGGTLSKWSAPVFFYASVISVLWLRGRLRELWRWPHLAGLAIATAICATWAVVVAAQIGWQPLLDTISREAFQRLFPAHYGFKHPWWETVTHPIRIALITLPMSALALITLSKSFPKHWDLKSRELLQGLHCWVWPNLIVWTLVSDHAARHSFPFFPGISGLAAMVWIAWNTGRLKWPVKTLSPGHSLVALLVSWCLVKTAFVHVIQPARCEQRQARLKAKLLSELIPQGVELYVMGFENRNEGLLYYLGRPVRFLPAESDCAPPGPSAYCLAEERLWRLSAFRWQSKELIHVADESNSILVLAQLFEAVRKGVRPLAQPRVSSPD